jgi:hemin uptake protein HemP
MTPSSPARNFSEASPVMNDQGGSSDVRRIPSREILAGGREVIVEHRGNDYRLRLTANGKLILTK